MINTNKFLSVLVMKLIFLTVSALLVSVSPAQGTEYLNPHNAARVAVNDVSMIWSTVVAAFAQTYANQRISSCANTPPSGSTYGENIAYSPNSFFSASDAVARWVSEKDNYDRPANTCNPGTICTRYTQVVWNNSIQLGCARVTCAGNTGALVVCNYSPKGNIAGQVPYAV